MGRYSSRASRNFVQSNKYARVKAARENAKMINNLNKINKEYEDIQNMMKEENDKIMSELKNEGMDSKLACHNRILSELKQMRDREDNSEEKINHFNSLIAEHEKTLSLVSFYENPISTELLNDKQIETMFVEAKTAIDKFNQANTNDKLTIDQFSDDFVAKFYSKFNTEPTKNRATEFLFRLFRTIISTDFGKDYIVATVITNSIFVANNENPEDEFSKIFINNIILNSKVK
jgi:hypothetical protein